MTVYVDGQCPMCVAGANRFQRFDARNRVRFVNLHDSFWALQTGQRFSGRDLRQEMRAQMPDGTWQTGYFAWAAILRALPLWRPLGMLMGLPLFYAVGPAVYRWVAAHRLQISRLLRLPPPCDENGVCRLDRPSRRER